MRSVFFDSKGDGMTGRLAAMLVVVVVGVATGVGVGAVAWAGGDHAGGADASAMDAMGHGSGATTGALDERVFLEQMVPHHQSAIEMANAALEKTRRPEIRTLARGIVSAQTREIADMKAWHLAWFGEELVPATSGPHASIDMSALDAATGDDFDRAFLRMMIPHHASAIMMADSVMMGSPREQISLLADEIIAAQAKEIGQMQRQREAWFPPLG